MTLSMTHNPFACEAIKIKTINLLKYAVTLSLIVPFTISTAIAEGWSDKIRINGFANTVARITDEATPIHGAEEEGGVDNKGVFTGSNFGFNITAKIANRVTLYSQMTASDQDKHKLEAKWAFIGVEVNDSLTFRGGTIKFPLGLINEYADVGYLYPWLTPPTVIYSQSVTGIQATRDGYSGFSLLYSDSFGDWTLGADFFGGNIKMDAADVRKAVGTTVKAEWNDEVLFQVSTYTGEMANSRTNPMMNGQDHTVMTMGIKADINDVIFYSEYADVTMGSLTRMTAKSWYASLGYRMGKLLPIVTYESFKQGEDAGMIDEQSFITLGLRYELLRNTALKLEYMKINTKDGNGMFIRAPSSNKTNMLGVGLSVTF